MNKIFAGFVSFICRHSTRRPRLFLIVALGISIPAIFNLQHLRMDTDFIRLLPENNRVVILKNQIKNIVTGSGGFFTVLLESADRERLLTAYQSALTKVQNLKEVEAIEYKNPHEFIKKYRYLLIPSDDLSRAVDSLIRLEAKISPMGEDLLSEQTADEEKIEREDKKEIRQMMRYLDLPPYHQSQDGRVMSIKIYPEKGVTSLGEIRKLSSRLKAVIQEISTEFDVWGGLSGSLVYDLSHYDFIVTDLARSILIVAVTLLITLFVGFRDFKAVPVVLLPLAFGLIWAFGSIPLIAERLNTITSFLLLISFGLGIDFSIHLVRRFQLELSEKPPDEALVTTFISSGKSVVLSGLTTALAFFILAFSNFRGFSEFGIMGGYSIVVILLAMMIFLPSILVLGFRLGAVRRRTEHKSRISFPGSIITIMLLALVIVSLIISIVGLKFDYDFDRMDISIPQKEEIENHYYKVYESRRSPGALFVARGITSLDSLLTALHHAKTKNPQSRILNVQSIRDLSPDDKETQLRLSLISEIKETAVRKWVQRVEDPDYRKLIDDIRDWNPPPCAPGFDELPDTFKNTLASNRYPDHYIVPVYIRGKKRNGINASAFAHELHNLPLSEGVIGPFGDTIVVSEILGIVTRDGPVLVIVTFIGIFLLVFWYQRSLAQTLLILTPLVSGLAMMTGIMVILGLKLNFFNIVVFPTLIGIGVDDGVHYYRRWREKQKDTNSTQKELFGTLSLTTATTMCSYLGIALSRHPGLQSIGFLACLGMGCAWLTTVFFLPGLLNLVFKRTEN
jgi:predicted RND superfamily exporter protein